MTTQFRIIARMFTAVVFCAAATASTATAADYVITWKNQFDSTAACTLNASVVGATATIPNKHPAQIYPAGVDGASSDQFSGLQPDYPLRKLQVY